MLHSRLERSPGLEAVLVFPLLVPNKDWSCGQRVCVIGTELAPCHFLSDSEQQHEVFSYLRKCDLQRSDRMKRVFKIRVSSLLC